jgi:hypothetical protein
MRGRILLGTSSRSVLLALTLLFASAWCLVPAAHATFHLNEINKVMTSFDGDVNLQAIELKMIANGENLVSGVSVVVYDGAGVQGATLGTFSANLPAGGVTGSKILLATMKWRQKFGVTPDLQISAGLLPTSGQIAIQTPTCVVSAIAYGDVQTFIGGGVSSAPPLPTLGGVALVRVQDNAIAPACPMAEDAAVKFQLRTASAPNPITFTNYSGVSATVGSTLTGVDETTGWPTPPRAYPNPFRQSIRIESPSAEWIGVFDVRGSLVRVVHQSRTAAAFYRGDWDGQDENGRPVPAGVYFIRHGRGAHAPVSRVALLR